MKARSVNEQNFERGKDPKRSMDIGRTPKRILAEFKKELDNLDIEIKYRKSDQYSSDSEVYEIIFQEDTEYWVNDDQYQMSYADDESAQKEWGNDDEEGPIGGFLIYSGDGEIIEGPTHDMNIVIKKLLSLKHGSIKLINDKLNWHDKEVKKLEAIKKKISS